MIAAEARVAAVLGIEREDLEGWGEDRLSIVKEDVPESVEAFRELLHDGPSPQVLLIVISVLGGSYHTRLVHDFLRDVAKHVYVEWLAGRRDSAIRIVLGDLPQRFHHGVTPDDFDLVMRFADEPTLALDEHGSKREANSSQVRVGRQRLIVMRRMRSSPSRGSARPSVLEVVSHREPSGAATTVRRRPNSPMKKACGSPVRRPPETGIAHRRLPRRPAMKTVPCAKAIPDGEATSVCHCAIGSTMPSSPAMPSAAG